MHVPTEVATSMAAGQNTKIGKMWTRFEEERRVNTSRRSSKERQGQREKWRRQQGTRQRQRENGKKAWEEGNGHIWEYPRETSREKREVGDDKDSAGHAARSDTSRQNVAGKSHASMRKMQKPEDNLNQKRSRGSVDRRECGGDQGRRQGLASTTHTERWKKAPASRGADPSSGHTLIVKKKEAPAAWGADPRVLGK